MEKKILLTFTPNAQLIEKIITLTEALNIKLESAGTVQEFQDKILLGTHDAVFMESQEPKNISPDLIAEIRSKTEQHIPIALLSAETLDGETFRYLKQNLQIDYVLEEPLSTDEFKASLKALVSGSDKKESQVTPLEELKRKYDLSIPDKIVQFEKEIQAVQSDYSRDSMEKLRNHIHQIAGSSGSYGHHKVSELSKAMEIQLLEEMKSATPPTKESLDSLDIYLKNIKFHFQIPDQIEEEETELSEMAELAEQILHPIVYFICNEAHLLHAIEKIRHKSALEIHLESDPEKAMAQLEKGLIAPHFIITSRIFPNSTINGYDLIRKAQNKKNIHSAILLDKENLDERINAIQNNVDEVIRRPVSAESLLHLFEEYFQSAKPTSYKALIVDDDPDICDFVKNSLEEVGISVHSLSDGSRLYETLRNVQPDLLFLDLILPEYDGLELLQTLRADSLYRNLTIIVLTVRDDPAIFARAYAYQVDEFINKPLEKRKLQAIALAFLEKAEEKDKSEKFDQLTGLPKLDYLREQVRKIIYKPTQKGTPQFLVVIEIDQFENIASIMGAETAEVILAELSDFLVSQLRQEESCAYSSQGRFYLILRDINPSTMRDTLYQRLKEASQNITAHLNSSLKITFSCGVTVIQPNRGVDECLGEAEHALELAQHIDGYVAIAFYPGTEQKIRTEDLVLMVDDDVELVQIVASALQQLQVSIKTAYNGTEALNYLLSQKQERLPLIICDRILPDMDGLELLRVLKKHNPEPIPLIFLSSLSSDKNIYTGLEEGALDYITKPFSLRVFVKKIMRYLNR